MLEITSDDIARLDDGQLRAVVARLCEAEVRSRRLSASYVTWGGNQNAADGGIAVSCLAGNDAAPEAVVAEIHPARWFSAGPVARPQS